MRQRSVFATVIAFALIFQLNLFAQQATVNVSGSWRGGHYKLTQNGDNVTSDGDFGHANGHFTGPRTFTMSWASATWTGTVSPDGTRIDWNNNTTWSRDGAPPSLPACQRQDISVIVKNDSSASSFEIQDNVCGCSRPLNVQPGGQATLPLCSSHALTDGYGSFKERRSGNTTWNNFDLIRNGETRSIN
jgi:hypothetical protein